jgi:hypothetical protein
MSEIVERVARAILMKGPDGPIWAHSKKDRRDMHLEMARTAIMAMREPTDEMVSRAIGDASDDWSRKDVAFLFAAMIDEALK